MKLPKIGLSALISILAALTIGEVRFIPNSQFKIINSQALAQTPVERKAEADRLLQQGLQQFQISQFQAALQSWQQALIIYREIKDRQSEGKALGNLGIAYNSLGDYAKAIEYAQQYLAIAREIKDRQSEGKALGNLGNAYYSLGDYAKAIEYAQQYLAIAREIKGRQSEGASLGNLGLAYYSLGDYAKAIEYAQQQLAIAREIKGRQSEGASLGNLGNAYYSLGDYAKAIEYEQQWLAIAREIKDRQSEGTALNNLGFALYKSGNLPAAETTLLDSIKVSESLRAGLDDANKVSIFETQTNPYVTLQQVLIAQKKTDDALEIAERGRARAFVELLASRQAHLHLSQLLSTRPTSSKFNKLLKSKTLPSSNIQLLGMNLSIFG